MTATLCSFILKPHIINKNQSTAAPLGDTPAPSRWDRAREQVKTGRALAASGQLLLTNPDGLFFHVNDTSSSHSHD